MTPPERPRGRVCPRCRTRYPAALARCPQDQRRLVADLTGEVVGGRYALRELIGVGGMNSTVWLAMQAPVDRPVAVKLLPPTTPEAADRFARGARIASKLNHPNITVVHDYGRTPDGHLYLVMELLEGHTLQAVVQRGPLPFERALHITDQILKALDHAHRRQVVHRDIKPGNLFLTPRNDDPDFVKVLDFGIARSVDSGPPGPDDEPHEEITTARQICGTPQYMAPEQITGGPVDQRSDLYALGVVFYRLLTGRLPFTERDHSALFMHHVHSAPPSFQEARPGLSCPAELEPVVMRALAKRPDARYASAAEMRRALRQIQRRLGITGALSEDSASISRVQPVGAPAPAPDHRRRRAVGAVALTGLAAAVGVWWAWPRAPEPAAPPQPVVLGNGPVAPPPPPPRGSPAEPTIVAQPAAVAAPPPAAADLGPPLDAAAPAPATLTVTSTPPGANLRDPEGALLGQTPLTLTRPAGRATFTLAHPGAEPATLTVDLAPGATAREAVTLRPRAPAVAPPRPRPPVRRPAPAPRVAPTQAPAPAPAPSAVAAPPTQAAPAAPPTVRLQLLDEREGRAFGVGEAPGPGPAAPATAAPRIELLE